MPDPQKHSSKVSRHDARQAVVQLLYQVDLNRDADEKLMKEFLRERLHFPALEKFAWDRMAGVRKNETQIDFELGSLAANWSVPRMSPVDRAILRLAIYELTSDPDTPRRVILNEAIELAKEFGGAESFAFVNGVLDAWYRRNTSSSAGDPAGNPGPKESE